MAKSGRPQDALSIPKRWPLVNRLQTRSPNVPITQDARLINCYAEADREDEEYWLYKRLGTGTPISSFGPGFASTGLGMGLYSFYPAIPHWGSPAYQVLGVFSDGSIWSYNGTTSTLVTSGVAIPAGYTRAWFETIASSPQTVAIGTLGSSFVYTPSVPSITHITDVNFPASPVPGWAYLDGTLYVMDNTGKIYNSQLNNATNWTPQSYILASSNADAGVALAKQLSYVIAFKQWTTQIFYDAGNPVGSPLAPVPDAQLPYGCFAAGSVAEVDDTLLWMTSNQTVSPQIVQMDNLSARIVSSPAVERLLDNAFISTLYPDGGIIGNTLKHGGHRFYFLTIVQLNITLVYDIDQGLWYLWTDANGNFWPPVSFAWTPMNPLVPGTHLVQMQNGTVQPIDGDYEYPTDNGTVFPVDIYTPNFDGGTDRRKVLKAIFPNGDTVNGPLQVRFSDDDFQSWSNFRTCDLSLKKPRICDMGTFRRRRGLHLRYAQPTTFRIKSLDMQLLWGSK